VKALIVDALASGKGKRIVTRDAIGAGPRAIAGVFENKGIEVRIVEAEKIFLDNFDLNDYDLLLLSGMSGDLTSIRNVIKKWYKKPVIIGGPVTSEPEKSLRISGADISVIGEGEETLLDLISLKIGSNELSQDQLIDIRGIAFKYKNRIFVNNLRPVMTKGVFNSFTPSVITIKNYSLYYASRVYLEVLRGCSNYNRETIENNEFCQDCNKCREGKLIDRYYCPLGKPPGCGYCSVPSLFGPPKSKSIHKICEEANRLLEIGVSRIVLSAPCILDYGRDSLVEPDPLTDPRNPEPNYSELEGLFSKITEIPRIKDGSASIMIENIKASLVTERAAKILGTYFKGTPVSIGFETGSEEHSIKLGRPSTPNESLNAIKMLKNAGLKPYVYFIHGLPGQSSKTALDTVRALNSSIRNGAERIILYRFQSLPMSAFCNYPNGSPYVKDKNSKIVYDAALKANNSKKDELKGEKIRVIIAERYDRIPKYYVAYPLFHGPVVLVEGKDGLEGNIIDVKIMGKASDRMVYGQF
jgi:radical SAM superfamily enzyme YgiQ (UPF0313 family)